MKLPSVQLVLPPTTFPSKSPLLLVTPGFPSEARLSLVLCGPLPTLQTSPPASGCFEIQPTPPPSHFPCVAALLRRLPLSLSPPIPQPAGLLDFRLIWKASMQAGLGLLLGSLLSGLQDGPLSWEAQSPISCLRSGSPSPGRDSLVGWHWAWFSSLPWKPLSACDPPAPDRGAAPCLCL